MKALTCFASAALIFGAFAPEALADGRKTGSVLFYPVHRSGTFGANPDNWFTIVSVTNTATQPDGPQTLGGSTNVHFEYVNVQPNPGGATNPLDKFLPLGCTIFDRIEFLTPADTLSVLTTCHNAAAAPGQEGYVVVSAENPALSPGNAWEHDYLMGSSMVLSASGVSYIVNAIPFEGIAPGHHGSLTNGSFPYTLCFDGTSGNYEKAPNTLMTDFVAAANSQLALINLTGGPFIENRLYFAVYNDNEQPLSATVNFRCWFDQPLSCVNPLFAEDWLAALPNDPDELDITCDGVGDIETGWMSIQSTGTFFSGGQPFDGDGVIIGSITAGNASVRGGHLLWERGSQDNGKWRTP